MPSKSPYSVHPSIAYTQKIIANLKTKTGRTIDEWIAFVKKSGPKTEADRRAWLKESHKLGTNYAWWIAERAEGKGGDEDNPEAYLRQAPKYVEVMYAGKRAALRPIYERLLTMGLGAGEDAKACPCKTDDIPTWLANSSLPSTAYAVVVTRGHRHDLDALRALAPRDLRYLGLIGSRAKVKRIYDVLVEDNSVPLDRLETIHAPIGLDIGAVTPQEIAVSIVAELIAIRRGKADAVAGASLRWMPKLRAPQGA